MHVLMLTDEPPCTGTAAANQIYFHQIRILSRHHRITLVCLSRSKEDQAAIPELRKYCSAIEIVNVERSRWKHLYHCLSATLGGQPFVNGYFADAEMHRRIRRLCRENRFDVIHIEHDYMAQYLLSVKQDASFKSVLFLHNIGPVMYERNFDVEDRPLRKAELGLSSFFSKRWVPRICRRFDKCVTFSEEDKRFHLSRVKDSDVSVIPMAFDIENIPRLPPPTHPADLLFIGKMEYAANRDAVHYFCREIFPTILATKNDVRFHIVGHPAITGLERFVPRETLNITGFVEDAISMYRRCAVSVVPLRAGSGVRGKILESMILGRPVVSTSLGCEGLKVTHGKDIWIADTPEAFAEGVLRLTSDEALWTRMAENGRRFVEDHHDCNRVYLDVLKLYEDLASREAQ